MNETKDSGNTLHELATFMYDHKGVNWHTQIVQIKDKALVGKPIKNRRPLWVDVEARDQKITKILIDNFKVSVKEAEKFLKDMKISALDSTNEKKYRMCGFDKKRDYFLYLNEIKPEHISQKEVLMEDGCMTELEYIDEISYAKGWISEFEDEVNMSKFFLGGKFYSQLLANYLMMNNNFATLRDNDDIWVYNSSTGCYTMDGIPTINEQAKDNLLIDTTILRTRETIHYIKSSTYHDRNEFDLENGEICLQNGIYNLNTNEFTEHTPDKFFTSSFPIVYNPDAKIKHITDFVMKVVSPREATSLLELFAFILMPGYPLQKIFVMYGPGGSGLSTMVKLIKRFVGDGNHTGVSHEDVAKDIFSKYNLYGKKVNLVGEMSKDAIKNTTFFKQMSGDDPVTCRTLNNAAITFQNSAKMIFTMNQVPEFPEDEPDAFYHRVVPFDFCNMIRGTEGEILKFDKIFFTEEEISGLFNTAIKLLPELLERKKFYCEDSTDEKRYQLNSAAKPLKRFIDERCELFGGHMVKKDILYNDYTVHCNADDITPMTRPDFTRVLKTYKVLDKGNIMLDGDRAQRYSGIMLASDAVLLKEGKKSNKERKIQTKVDKDFVQPPVKLPK